MTDTATPETTEATEATETEARTVGARSQLAVHEGQVQYLRDQGLNVDSLSPAELIAAAYATRNEWRRTDAYRAVKDAATTEKAKEREAAKEARRAEREAKKAEREKAKAEKEKAKAEKEKSGADGQVMKEQPKKARRRRAANAETEAPTETSEADTDNEDENPFED